MELLDRAALYRLIRGASPGFEWRGVGPGTSADALETFLKERVLAQFLLARADDSNEVVGLAQCLAPDFVHGAAQVAVLLRRDYHGRGWPLEGVALFMSYLFNAYPLRKLYLEVPDLNDQRFGRGLGRIFKYEGTLSEHEWHVGAFRDVHFYSMHRDSFLSILLLAGILRHAS